MLFPISKNEHTLLCAIRGLDFKKTIVHHEEGKIRRIESMQDIPYQQKMNINTLIDTYDFQDICISVHQGAPHITQTIKEKIIQDT
jgi:hypothetical protein